MKRIAKVKLSTKDKSVTIIESEGTEFSDSTETKYVRYGVPHADFTKALDALVPHVRDILELPSNWKLGDIRITGVTVSCSEDTEVEGAVISGLVTLTTATSPFSFNTPHLPFDQYAEGNEAPLMPEDAVDAIEEVRKEARQFLNGKRAETDQKDLFASETPADAVPN